MGFVTSALDFWRRPQRKWLLLMAAVSVSTYAAGYGAYKAYSLPSVVQKRRKLAKFFQALISLSEAVSSTSEAISFVSSDLHRFLRSDSDEIPQSLKQISKIATSHEFADSVSKVSEALTSGIVQGLRTKTESTNPVPGAESGFSDRVLEKLFSSSGMGFASVVVGSFAKNLVLAFYSNGGSDDRTIGIASDSAAAPRWVTLICGNPCRELIADSIQRFVSTAVTIYLDKTMHINIYDDLFSGLTNPKHEPKVKDMLVSVCNGAMETLVKTSHEVLTGSNSSSPANGVEGGPEEEKESGLEQKRSPLDLHTKDVGGWLGQVSNTLAVPKNRKFVLDMTGRVTFEMVRSVLDFGMWKLYDGTRRGISVVHEEMVEGGLKVMRYVCAKSMVIATICLALCMHILTGTRVLMPA